MSSSSTFHSTPTCAQIPPASSRYANNRQKRAYGKSGKGQHSRRRLPQPQFEGSPRPHPPSSPRRTSPSPDPEDGDSPARKRRRRNHAEESNSDSTSSSGSEGDEPDGRFPVINRKYWRSKGKIFGRCVEMWDTFNGIMDQGTSRNPGLDGHAFTKFENQQYQKCRLLLELSPTLAKLLKKNGGQDFTKALHCMMDIGRKRAQRADVNGIRGAIGQWPGITWEPAFPVLRHLLRFNHPTSGELLCPVTLDWDDPNVRERLRRGVEEVTAADLPAFLWPKGAFDLVEPFEGFLRGPLLVMAYKHIFISPSSAKESDRSTRGGNAALHDIRSVTFESIAYVATVTRFALSDEASFNPGGPCSTKRQRIGFPYRDFYHEILEHKSLMSSGELSDLIQWWDEIIFPCTVYGSGNVKKNSVGALMRERVKAKQLKAARQAASAQAITSGAGASAEAMAMTEIMAAP